MNGLQTTGPLLLLATTTLLVAAGTYLFTRRDIAV